MKNFHKLTKIVIKYNKKQEQNRKKYPLNFSISISKFKTSKIEASFLEEIQKLVQKHT